MIDTQPPESSHWSSQAAISSEAGKRVAAGGVGGTHLYHLLYVFSDNGRVSVGLHRHSPLIDHGWLGVRHGGRAGVLLQRMRNPRPQYQYHRGEAEPVMLRREGSCSMENKPWWERTPMPIEKKTHRFPISTQDFTTHHCMNGVSHLLQLFQSKRGSESHVLSHGTSLICRHFMPGSFTKSGKEYTSYQDNPSHGDGRRAGKSLTDTGHSKRGKGKTANISVRLTTGLRGSLCSEIW